MHLLEELCVLFWSPPCLQCSAVNALLEYKEFMSCELRVCESCILQILGVFVSDNSTGISLQQKAERSSSSRSPSRSPSIVSPGFTKEPSSHCKTPVPRLELSPNALRKCTAQSRSMSKTSTLSGALEPSNQEYSFITRVVLMKDRASDALNLNTRREQLLLSLLQNEQDSIYARNECWDA